VYKPSALGHKPVLVDRLSIRVQRLSDLVWAPGVNNLQALVPRLPGLVWAPGVLCRPAGLALQQESSIRNSRRRSLCHLKVSRIYRKTLP
jgi:hypothetical protein